MYIVHVCVHEYMYTFRLIFVPISSNYYLSFFSQYAERLTALEDTCQSSLASTGRDFRENVQILQQVCDKCVCM